MKKWSKQHPINVGDKIQSKRNGWYVVTYNNSSLDVGVQFCLTGFKKNCCDAKEVRSGTIKDPYFPFVCGVGYLGEGTYTSNQSTYKVWSDMLMRCYSLGEEAPTYQRCYVDPSWHNYQVFAEWYENNTPLVGSDVQLNLDKDLLVVRNEVYGPSHCVIIPMEVNNFLVSRPLRAELPTGVCSHGSGYRAQGNAYGKHWQGIVRRTVEDAFQDYIKEKEGYAKFLAKKWDGILDRAATRALSEYSVIERMYNSQD